MDNITKDSPDIRQQCVDVLLRQFVSIDPEKAKSLVVLLRDNEVLTSVQRKDLTKLIKEGNSEEASKKIIQITLNAEGGLLCLIAPLKEEEICLDERVTDILEGALLSEETDAKTVLVSSWNKLITFRQEANLAIQNIWPGQTQFTEESWPLDFVHFCITKADPQKTGDFVNSMSFTAEHPFVHVQSEETVSATGSRTYQDESVLMYGNPVGISETADQITTIPHSSHVIVAPGDGTPIDPVAYCPPEQAEDVLESDSLLAADEQIRKIEVRARFKGMDTLEKEFTLAIQTDNGVLLMGKRVFSHGLEYYSATWELYATDNCYSYVLFKSGKVFKKEVLPNDTRRILPPNVNVVFDVAKFESSKPSFAWNSVKNWTKMMHKQIRYFLPPAGMVLTGEKSHVHHVILLLRMIKVGWNLIRLRTRGIENKKLDDRQVEQMLEEWLHSIENEKSSQHDTQHTLCTLSVILGLYESNHQINDEKLFTRICNGLLVRELNAEKQNELFRNASNDLQTESLRKCLEFLYGHVRNYTTVECILTFPLYNGLAKKEIFGNRMICNPPQNLLYHRAFLPGVDENCKGARETIWERFRDEIHGDSTKMRQLKELVVDVEKISKIHPWIIDTYQFFLPQDFLLEVIKDNQSFTDEMFIDSVFDQLLPMLNRAISGGDVVKYREMIGKTSDYFTRRLDKLSFTDYINRLNEDEKVIQSRWACHILENLQKNLKTAVDENKNSKSSNLYILWVVKMTSKCTTWWINLGKMKTDFMADPAENALNILNTLKQRISTFFKAHTVLEQDEIEFYNNLFKQQWEDMSFQQKWDNEIGNEVKEVISKLQMASNDAKKFLKLYILDLKDFEFERELDFILQGKATTCIMEIPDGCGFLCAPTGRPTNRLYEIVVDAYKKEFKKYQRGDSFKGYEAVTFLVDSPVPLQVYSIFGKGKRLSEILSPSQYKGLEKVDKVANNLLDNIKKGVLSVREMRIIISQQSRIKKLIYLKTEQETECGDPSFATLQEKLVDHDKVMNAFKAFLNFCSSLGENFKVDCDEVKKVYSRSESCLKFKDMEEYHVNETEKTGILLLYTLQESQILLYTARKWLSRELSGNNSPVNSDGVISRRYIFESMWPSVKEQLLEFIHDLRDAKLSNEIQLERFEFTKGEREKLEKELCILYSFASKADNSFSNNNDLNDDAKEKADQLLLVFKIQRHKEAFHWFAKFEKFGETLGFRSLVNYQGTQTKISNDEKEAIDRVVDISGEQLQILMSFSQQEDLILWLRSKWTHEGQVHQFCLMAADASFHNAKSSGYWSCLSDAVGGFAKLIFGLDKMCCKKDLLDRCSDVWKKVETDSNIRNNWLCAGKNLDWYKENEDMQESHDHFALTFAKRVNTCGVYKLGNIKSIDSVNVTIEDTIEVAVKQDQDQSAVEEEYGIDYLRRVYSILTLKSSDDNDAKDVQQFTKTFVSMESLARAYTDLANAGFILFSDWKLVASCKMATAAADLMIDQLLTIHISFESSTGSLSRPGCINDIIQLSGLLRDALTRWNKHIDQLRLKYYLLNDYNIKQIKYLCSQLGNTHSSPLHDQVFLLLSKLPRQVVEPMIHESLIELGDNQEDSHGQEEEDHTKGVAVIVELAVIPQKWNAVNRLMKKQGMTRAVAKAAVQAKGYGNDAQCRGWLLRNRYNDSLIREKSMEFDKEAGYYHQDGDIPEDSQRLPSFVTNLGDLVQILQKRAASTNHGLLSAVKTIYVAYITSTNELSPKGYLNVNNLGRFLAFLHKHIENHRKCPTRALPEPGIFKLGEPNLLIVADREIMATICFMYLHKAGSEKNLIETLPTPREVLVCTPETSSDEVNRFMIRAMHKHPLAAQQLFCLAFTEKLSFIVYKDLENTFTSLSQNSSVGDSYQLVIISSDPNHFVANLFDEYRREAKSVFEEQNIGDHIKLHMMQNSVENSRRVEVVTSKRSGMGKSLHVKREIEKFSAKSNGNVKATTVRLLEKDISTSEVVKRLLTQKIISEAPHLVHIDVTPAVETGLEKFLFDLIILGMIDDSSGRVWRRQQNHFYRIEITKFHESLRTYSWTLEYLPTVECLSPIEALEKLQNNENDDKSLVLIDEKEYLSDVFQRPYQYLSILNKDKSVVNFCFKAEDKRRKNSENLEECIELMLKECGIKGPSWAQLKYFAIFLNNQLKDCESNVYFTHDNIGVKNLIVKFMIRMARDFASPSLVICDESSKDYQSEFTDMQRDVLSNYQLRRTWEESEHPFIFFNDDKESKGSINLINVNIDASGNLIDKRGCAIEENFVSEDVVESLKLLKAEFGYNLHKFSRNEMIAMLCQIMGLSEIFDPDPTFELTADNVMKIIAIHMRLRCDIPIIIMGETGSGKTRMVEFISKLQAGKNKTEAEMQTLKVHGGTGIDDIFKSVGLSDTVNVSLKQRILFYDEANTTTAIYAIKEVMCDCTINGDPFSRTRNRGEMDGVPNMQIIAACNPYKKLSTEALEKLEASGLGYKVAGDETKEKLGSTLMRHLLYRVVALPPSIQPFVWDFGRLSDETERLYIGKMVSSRLKKYDLKDDNYMLIVNILSRIQSYMKKRNTECRCVSLRDPERTIKLFKWFYTHKKTIFPEVEKISKTDQSRQLPHPAIPGNLRCLIHAVGVAYYASVKDRTAFLDMVAEELVQNGIDLTTGDLLNEYTYCQNAFCTGLNADDDIAWNEALRENVFLTAVCADNKLPLFIVGKPGSSKSLARSIVESNMKGTSSSSNIFKKLRKIKPISFKCSAQTKASEIKDVFRRASEEQREKDLKKFASMIVLEEIGLAEDSQYMPLKVLHPLLECGNADFGSLSEHKEVEKVAFVGISNWALDPAKMNRGIFVMRCPPSEADLLATAKSIFEGSRGRSNQHCVHLENLTKTYLDIYTNQRDRYYGLRDYYSSIKMLHRMTKKEHNGIDLGHIAYILARNYSGGKSTHKAVLEKAAQDNFDITADLLHQPTLKRLVDDNIMSTDDRFLLLLTPEHSSVALLEYIIPDFNQTSQVIYGSSFPGDHTYTYLCKNVSRIKSCMKEGKRVVLLNVHELHESLYELLNLCYIRFGRRRYAQIGVGSHHEWTIVDEKFRLLIIEKKESAHGADYPIPLLNRLEKHHLTSSRLLSSELKETSTILSSWITKFAEVGQDFNVINAFIGSHEETANTMVLVHQDQNIEDLKQKMLATASADAVFRLPSSELSQNEIETSISLYTKQQTHDCLLNFLDQIISKSEKKLQLFEITTFSNILTEEARKNLEYKLGLMQDSIMLLSLQQFKVEEEYSKKIDDFFKRCEDEPQKDGAKIAILLIQTPKAHKNGQLMECAKHNFMNNKRFEKMDKLRAEKVIVSFIHCTERTVEKTGLHSGVLLQQTQKIEAVYIDELRHSESNSSTALISSFYDKTLKDLLSEPISVGKDGMECYITCVLRECLTEAMSKVSSSISTSKRQLDRIKDLRELLTHTPGQRKLPFAEILLRKMAELIKTNNEPDKMKWITQEASSQIKLQVGGTFGKTIHLCLKRHLADMLALIVSVIDEDNNISILLGSTEGMEWKIELWFQIFKILDMCSYELNKTEYKSPTYSTASCRFPFSFILNRKLLPWYEVRKGCESEEQFFYTSTRKIEILQIVQNQWDVANNGMAMMQAYAYDLLNFQLRSQEFLSQTFLENLSWILHEFSIQRWNHHGRKYSGIAVTLYTFAEIADHLHGICSISIVCPKVMENVTEWLRKQQTEPTFQVHEYALYDALCCIQDKAKQIEDVESCAEWMKLCSQIKTTYSQMSKLTHEEKLIKKWEPIDLLEILFMHLLPSDKDPSFSQYLDLIIFRVSDFSYALEECDIHSLDFLQMIAVVLRQYCDDLKLKLKLNWQSTCVCNQTISTPRQTPCGRAICDVCLDYVIHGANKCPYCKSEDCKPDNIQLCSPKLSDDAEKQLENFQMKCTAYFLQYLYQLCFNEKADGPDAEKKMLSLCDIFLPQSFASSTMESRLDTTELKMNIATKCSVFSLMLKRRPNIAEKFQEHLYNKNVFNDDLIVAFLRCFEHSQLEKLGNTEMLLDSWKVLLGSEGRLIDIDLLVNVAKVRCSLNSVTEHIEQQRLAASDCQSPTDIVLRAVSMCKQESATNLRHYITKVGLLNYGQQWLKYVLENDELNSLVNMNIASTLDENMHDFWNILGPCYMRFMQKAAESKLTVMREVIEQIQCNSPQGVLCRENIPRFLVFMQLKKESRLFLPFSRMAVAEIKLRQLMKSHPLAIDVLFCSQRIKECPSLCGFTKPQWYAVYQGVILATFLVLCKLPLMDELRKLLMVPEKADQWYWPAMPESLYETVGDAMEYEQPYSCPRGHVYYIGDCTYPDMMSDCPECGSAIGGFDHIKSEGNERLPLNREKGYQLHWTRLGVNDPADRLTQQAASVIHFFIHSCMIMAMLRKPGKILNTIQQSDQTEGLKYLSKMLENDIENLSRGLGCSVDESIMVLHQILAGMVFTEHEEIIEAPDWSTKCGSRSWEKEFRSEYLVPVFQDVEKFVYDAKTKLFTPGVFESFLAESVLVENSEERLTCFHPVLWMLIKEPTSAHLLHCIADSSIPSNVLCTIVRTPNLHLVKFLPNILKLQKEFIQRFQNRSDMNDVEKTTLDDTKKDVFFAPEIRERIHDYIYVWNLLLPLFKEKYSQGDATKSKSISKRYMQEMTWNTPISMAIPTSRGRGRCAKILAEYLIDIHNQFLTECKTLDKSLKTIGEIEISMLQPSQVVSVDKKGDLLPMIHLHMSYTIKTDEYGRHHCISYDIPALERQAKAKYVLNKKLIMKESLPCIRYVEDVGLDWEKVKNNVKQEPLPDHILTEIEEMLTRENLADICEGIRTITQAICFLAKVQINDKEKKKRLHDYLTEDLVLSATRLATIPRSALICHTLALYQKLSCYKAVRFVQQGLDPYEGLLHYAHQEKIRDKDTLTKLKSAFERTNLGSLQEHLNELIIQMPDFNREWSLRSILSNFEFIDENPSDAWYSHLPDELLFKNATDLFRLSVEGIHI